MLILTRRVGEKLIIGESVTVTVLGVKGAQVRVGIDAPSNVKVHREEIYQRILKEKKSLNNNNRVKILAPTVRVPAPTVKISTRTISLSDKRK